ncbi:hypothetical protein ATANTOWER_026496 [Ataeniobius toweri]|uniref:Uncharacterized protein n=1 Tax=Ataeniobius toweri TaxID=208326 RepID=A0ABU7CLT7_9TELE|nr:hypothetical protein [Ataeniobius toweri]
MNNNFYQRFAVIQKLSTLFILAMDFMTRASSIHISTRTVFMDDIPCPLLDEDVNSLSDFLPATEMIMSLNTLDPNLATKVSEASLQEDNKNVLFDLLSKFGPMFNGHLG